MLLFYKFLLSVLGTPESQVTRRTICCVLRTCCTPIAVTVWFVAKIWATLFYTNWIRALVALWPKVICPFPYISHNVMHFVVVLWEFMNRASCRVAVFLLIHIGKFSLPNVEPVTEEIQIKIKNYNRYYIKTICIFTTKKIWLFYDLLAKKQENFLKMEYIYTRFINILLSG